MPKTPPCPKKRVCDQVLFGCSARLAPFWMVSSACTHDRTFSGETMCKVKNWDGRELIAKNRVRSTRSVSSEPNGRSSASD